MLTENETFYYDNPDRLDSVKIGTFANTLQMKMLYDPNGNITYKTGLGEYGYLENGSARPHALTSVENEDGSITFGQEISYSYFNKAKWISDTLNNDIYTLDIDYGADRQRVKATLRKKEFCMNILMILDHEFPPDVRVENEIDTLLKAGHEVHIACYTRKGKPLREKVNGLTIHRKPISSFIYKSSVANLTLPFYSCFWKKFISEILSALSFDVIHIHDLPLAGVGVKIKKKHNMRLVIDLHENWPGLLKMSKHTNTLIGRLVSPLFLWRRYEKRVLQHADALIVVVDEARTRLSGLGIPAGRISVVSNTINPEGLNLHETKHGDDIILYYAGAINYHRGLQSVILAMHRSKNTRIKFRIVGDGSYISTLVKLVKRLSLQNRVTFSGYQPFKKLMEMMAESDFAIIPHMKSEHTDSTIPHKLFQYMYAGKPVIASDCIPIKRILEETGSGIVFPSGDIEYLSRVLDDLESLNSNEMSLNGRKAVTEKYNWDVDGKNLISTYKKLEHE